MPECTNTDLENTRLRQKIPRWKLAGMLGVSESTIARWESGEIRPDPDDVDRFAIAVSDPTLWHRWMLSNYDSYRRRYIDSKEASGLSALMGRYRYETGDVMAIHNIAERDALDGKIDDPQLKQKLIKELQEQIAAGSDLLQELLK